MYANAKNPDMGEVDEEDETYESDGKEIELDNELWLYSKNMVYINFGLEKKIKNPKKI